MEERYNSAVACHYIYAALSHTHTTVVIVSTFTWVSWGFLQEFQGKTLEIARVVFFRQDAIYGVQSTKSKH